MRRVGKTMDRKAALRRQRATMAPIDIPAGSLRVWHIPQVPMPAFRMPVLDIEQAKLLIGTLARYDAFQLEHNIKPDYANVSGLEVFEDGEWCEWYDDDGDDIMDVMRRTEAA